MMNIQNIDREYIANTYARFPLTIVSGKGSLVYDENGIPCSRLDLIEHEILDTLCGINEFGTGGFQFSRELSNLCVQNTSLSNSKSFFGSSFVLACNWVEVNDYGCE
jgi:acetylornithine/succinyldiaminopimelate/putrescine aminotransferase